jgi:VanZ family protein
MDDVPLPNQVISNFLRAWKGPYTRSPIETLVRFVPAALYTGLIFRLSSTEPDRFPAIAIDDRIAHFVEYAVLAVLVMFFLAAVTGLENRTMTKVIVSVAIAALIGMLDEWNQSFVPGRDSSWKDVAFDVLGASFSSLLIAVLLRKLSAGSESSRRGVSAS